MYLNDPTLYGATLPQREIVPPFYPFYGQMPFGQLPYGQVPFGQLPMQLPWQNFQKFVPPMFQGVPPYFMQYGFTPFIPPYAWQHFMPMEKFQRPLWY